jgi:hypothetical protein
MPFPGSGAAAARESGTKRPADKGSDYRHVRRWLRQRHMQSRIARRGGESSTRLGRHRWVVQRTFAWLNRDRRPVVRYERRLDIHPAVLGLGCSLICWNFIQRFC